MNTHPTPFLIAVDPGGSGGIAWFKPGFGAFAIRTPDTEEALLQALQEIVRQHFSLPEPRGPLIAVFEIVGGYVKPPKIKVKPGDNGEPPDITIEGGQPGSAMFRFGESAGLVRGMLRAMGARVQMVAPQAWQAPLFMKKGGRAKEDWKRALKEAAQKRFPKLKVTLKTADALLLLHYAGCRYNPEGIREAAEQSNEATGQPKRRTGLPAPLPGNLNPPEGYVPIKEGSTKRFDLVWNKDSEEWEKVDSVNEHVSEYIAVARPVVCKLRELFRAEGMTLEEAMRNGKTSFIVRWKDEPWIAYQGTMRECLSQRATPIDLMTLPPR